MNPLSEDLTRYSLPFCYHIPVFGWDFAVTRPSANSSILPNRPQWTDYIDLHYDDNDSDDDDNNNSNNNNNEWTENIIKVGKHTKLQVPTEFLLRLHQLARIVHLKLATKSIPTEEDSPYCKHVLEAIIMYCVGSAVF